MFNIDTLIKENIAEFNHQGMLRYSDFVPRLYNMCLSLGFTPGKIMPSRAFCSDENQGYPVIVLAKHFGTFPFNHGIAGGIVATDRHAPHAHHGKDLVIIHASHVGYDPNSQTFGTYSRRQTENNVPTPTCGKLYAMVDWYQEEYRFAANNIRLRRMGDEHHIVIDNQLLNTSRPEGLFLRLENFVAKYTDGSFQVVRAHSTSKSYRLTPSAIELLGSESFSAGRDRRIGRQLSADWFYYKREPAEANRDRQPLERSLVPIMPHIVTSAAPLLAVAQNTTQVEFDRAFRTIAKAHAYEHQKILLVSGLNIDVSPAADQLFPLTKFVPWAAFYKDEQGNTQTWEQDELVETLGTQPLENPHQIDLEAAIGLMRTVEEVRINWPF